jgi:hypothetical protein
MRIKVLNQTINLAFILTQYLIIFLLSILSQLLLLIERIDLKKIGFYCWKIFIFDYFRVYEVSFKKIFVYRKTPVKSTRIKSQLLLSPRKMQSQSWAQCNSMRLKSHTFIVPGTCFWWEHYIYYNPLKVPQLVVGIFETFDFEIFREYYRTGSRVISRPEKSRKFFNAFFD